MKYYDVMTKKLIPGKTLWRQVGKLTEFDDGGLGLELHMFPDTKFYLFDQDRPKPWKNNTVETEAYDSTPKEAEPIKNDTDFNDDIPF